MPDIRDPKNGVTLTPEQRKIFQQASQDFAQSRVDFYKNMPNQKESLIDTKAISGGELSPEEQSEIQIVDQKADELLEDIKEEAIDLIKEALKKKGYSQESIEQICSNEQTNSSEILAQRKDFNDTLQKVINAILQKKDREVRGRLMKTEDGQEQAITEQAMSRCGVTIKPFPITSDSKIQKEVDKLFDR